MSHQRLSTFPLDKPFERQEPLTPLSEIALRLVVDFYTDVPYIVGTATMLCGNLLVTARHIFTDIVQNLSPNNRIQGIIDQRLSAVQIIPGPDPEYVIWDVFTATLDPATDIALLQLAASPGRSDLDRPHTWKQLSMMPFAPAIGDRIAAFGYRLGNVKVSKNAQGGNHYDMNDEPMMSIGEVREIHEWRHDSVMRPFPCYQVSARFDAGMSGGPVFDEAGNLCGIVCSNIDGSHLDGEPVSYVSTLWPLFRLIHSQDRGDNYPRGVRYPLIELARGGQIKVADYPRLEAWFSQHITGQPV